MIQHKQAGKRYHRIDLEELKQLRSDAIQEYKVPIYMIEFDDYAKPFYLVDEERFEQLRNLYE